MPTKKGEIPEIFINYHQKYYFQNRDAICKRMKAHFKKYPEIRRKSIRINNWKNIGIIDSDFDSLYKTYIKETHCWICGREFTNSRFRHLDHDHETGEPRYICCIKCNTKVLVP
jgi:DNA-directed RNA polymerase subunit RPC12/RpoP